MLAKLKTLPDIVDADSTLITGKPELRVVIDRARAGDLGVRIGDIAQSLNTLVAGQKVSTFNAGVDQYDVRVRAIGQYRANAEGLQRMIVASQKLGWVSLDNLVRIEEGTGPSSIDRYNRQRQVTLTANTKPGGSQAAIIGKLQQFANEENMDSTYTTSLAGRSKELSRTGFYFLLAIVLSFIFMYMVLAAQFESFIHPITILLTLPLAIPFGIVSLLVTGQTVNIFSGLGLLLLFGVVKKNAILQIDHTNGLRRQGMERHEAIVQANRDRLRPILMTTIALVAGMTPLTISSGPGSGTNRSIGVLVVGGQSLCLLLTLLAVPVFYSLFDDLARSRVWGRIGSFFGGVFGRVRRRAAAATASLLSNMFKIIIIGFVLVLFAAHRGLAQEPVASPTPDQVTSAPQAVKLAPIAFDFRANARKPLPSLMRVGVDVNDQKPLSLRDAMVLALQNNKDIAIARDSVRLAEADLLTSHGAYDPRLTAQSYFERITTPATSVLSGAAKLETSDFTATSRLEGLTPKYGGNYHVDFTSIRSTSNSAFNVLNPQYPTALTFTFAQPLWRGRGFDLPRRQIEVAKKNLSLTDAQFRQRAIEVITSVQRSYWDLVFTLRNLQIQRESLADARTQLEHNRRMVTEGTLAPIDIVAAQTQVANLEQAEFAALDDVNRAENNLKNLIAEDQKAAIWNTSLIPTDDVDLTVPPVVLSDAMKAALDNRPELRESDLAREINQLDQKLYRDLTKPQVDLVGTYGVTGNAGTLVTTTNPLTASNELVRQRVNELSGILGVTPPIPAPPTATIPPTLLGGYPQSVQNLFSNDFNNFRVGLTISLPLRNRTAEGQLAHSEIEGDRIATQRQQLEQLIQVEVRNALQTVTTSEARLRSAAVARENAEQQYESEKRKLDVGQSTVFLVLERQTALTIARGNELRAQTDLNKAIAEFQRATGNSLTANNVSVTSH
jgi:HAE1 family hydrophobic/amphiphilic exporter-1